MFQSFVDTMINGQRYMLIVEGLGITLLIAFCAILIGTVLGFIFALMKVSGNKILKPIAELYTTVLRGIPLATQLMIFYFVIFAPLGLNRLLVAILAYGLILVLTVQRFSVPVFRELIRDRQKQAVLLDSASGRQFLRLFFLRQ